MWVKASLLFLSALLPLVVWFPPYNLCLRLFQVNLGAALLFCISELSAFTGPFQVARAVKILPASVRENKMWVRSLGREDALEEGMAAHSSILAWRIPWTEELAGYTPWGHKESDTTEAV